MKAIVIHAPHDLRIEEREVRAPGPGEVSVRVARGGVCGSDLHYYQHGGFGTVRLKEPMILGHEVAGHVEALGEGVEGLKVGQLVAVSPSRHCGSCAECLRGLPNHCVAMRFYGSAMPMPHIQGAFREVLVAQASQCVAADGLSPETAALAEPLAVAVHAVERAGPLMGRRVLVTGCGPIGCLAVAAARAAGAGEVVATDIAAAPLAMAERMGATRALDTSVDPDAMSEYARGPRGDGKGTFDVMLECSGAAPALAAGLAAMRPRGRVVQLGLGGDMSVPMMLVTAKELEVVGSFRFHEAFATAVAAMRDGRIDVSALVTHTVPLADAEEAFRLASDRASGAMKAQIAFA